MFLGEGLDRMLQFGRRFFRERHTCGPDRGQCDYNIGKVIWAVLVVSSTCNQVSNIHSKICQALETRDPVKPKDGIGNAQAQLTN